MAWIQKVKPNTSVKDYAGWCLRFAQSVYNAPARHASAWQAWLNAPGRHANRSFPTNVPVILWFSHWGTYGGIYANWGHVVVRVPGRGFLSSPRSGYGQEWFSSIAAVERAFNSKYVGWSEGINGKITIEWVPNPKPKPKPVERNNDMLMAYYAHAAGKGKGRWVVFGPNFWLEISSKNSANALAKQIGAPSLVTNQAGWNKFKRSALGSGK